MYIILMAICQRIQEHTYVQHKLDMLLGGQCDWKAGWATNLTERASTGLAQQDVRVYDVAANSQL